MKKKKPAQVEKEGEGTGSNRSAVSAAVLTLPLIVEITTATIGVKEDRIELECRGGERNREMYSVGLLRIGERASR